MNRKTIFKTRFFKDKDGNGKIELRNIDDKKGIFKDSSFPKNETGDSGAIAVFTETTSMCFDFCLLNACDSKPNEAITFLYNSLRANDGKAHFFNIKYIATIDYYEKKLSERTAEEVEKIIEDEIDTPKIWVVDAKTYDMEKNADIALKLIRWLDSLSYKDRNTFYKKVNKRRGKK